MFESLLVVLCGNPFFPQLSLTCCGHTPCKSVQLFPTVMNSLHQFHHYCNDEIGAKRGLVRKQKQVSA